MARFKTKLNFKLGSGEPYLFHPTLNPIPFPKPGQVSGVYGSYISGKEGADDLDEIFFLFESSWEEKSNEMSKRWGDENDGTIEGVPPVRNRPEIVAYLKDNYEEFLQKFNTYDSWDADIEWWTSMSGARAAERVLKGIYPDTWEQELQKFVKRLPSEAQTKFNRERLKSPFEVFQTWFSESKEYAMGKAIERLQARLDSGEITQEEFDKEKARVESNLKKKTEPSAPGGEVSVSGTSGEEPNYADKLMDRYSKGEISKEDYEKAMRNLHG